MPKTGFRVATISTTHVVARLMGACSAVYRGLASPVSCSAGLGLAFELAWPVGVLFLFVYNVLMHCP
jgi:hypothetical protein